MKKIIIAEDSSVIQNLTRKILEIQNYEITSVKNGEDVLTTMESDNFDLILMDINMPKMDGLECSRQIRKISDPLKSKIPIIAITGNAMNYSSKDFQDAGINEFVPKPLNFDILVDMVKKHTENAG